MTKKIRVGVLFGGQSAEHEVSMRSARSIIKQIDPQKYDVMPIGIDKRGSWFFLTVSQFLNLFSEESMPTFDGGTPPSLEAKDVFFSPCVLRRNFDVIFPVLHGPYGEDGTVQGLLRLADLPYVGADVLGSAICMDKSVSKCLLKNAHLPIPRFQTLHKREVIDLQALMQTFTFPLFVKPANLGSSVGISKVYRFEELSAALEEAFEYDEKIMIEEFIEGRELECSVLGNLDPIASLPGEIISQHDFYSYEAKYLDQEGALFELPAKLADQTVKEIQTLAVQAFRVLQCEGMARVDFFLRPDGQLFLNELNTIPGFTTISLYPKLWEFSGIPYSQLVERLISLAFERHQRKSQLKSDVSFPLISQ